MNIFNLQNSPWESHFANALNKKWPISANPVRMWKECSVPFKTAKTFQHKKKSKEIQTKLANAFEKALLSAKIYTANDGKVPPSPSSPYFCSFYSVWLRRNFPLLRPGKARILMILDFLIPARKWWMRRNKKAFVQFVWLSTLPRLAARADRM